MSGLLPSSTFLVTAPWGQNVRTSLVTVSAYEEFGRCVLTDWLAAGRPLSTCVSRDLIWKNELTGATGFSSIYGEPCARVEFTDGSVGHVVALGAWGNPEGWAEMGLEGALPQDLYLVRWSDSVPTEG
jgi:hypothetical protein